MRSFLRAAYCPLARLPGYLGAYIHPSSALDPKTIESVMLTVNSINTCPYCTGLHGRLAEMASVDKIQGPAVEYAKVFAAEVGRGAAVRKAFDKLVRAEGVGRAKNVRALCWALHWGKTTGNSINAVRAKLVSGRLWTVSPFELLLFAFYGPLFLAIGLVNWGLRAAPTVPPWVSTTIGATLWLPQMVHILPAGLVCLFLRLLAFPIGGLDL